MNIGQMKRGMRGLWHRVSNTESVRVTHRAVEVMGHGPKRVGVLVENGGRARKMHWVTPEKLALEGAACEACKKRG
jgi:hypothetical protein